MPACEILGRSISTMRMQVHGKASFSRIKMQPRGSDQITCILKHRSSYLSKAFTRLFSSDTRSRPTLLIVSYRSPPASEAVPFSNIRPYRQYSPHAPSDVTLTLTRRKQNYICMTKEEKYSKKSSTSLCGALVAGSGSEV